MKKAPLINKERCVISIQSVRKISNDLSGDGDKKEIKLKKLLFS